MNYKIRRSLKKEVRFGGMDDGTFFVTEDGGLFLKVERNKAFILKSSSCPGAITMGQSTNWDDGFITIPVEVEIILND